MSAIPNIDFQAWFQNDQSQKLDLVDKLRRACETHGFFQLTNHGIPQALLDAALVQSKAFFDLPIEIKEKYDKNIGRYNRGYERFRAQNFEKRTEGDLKEGYYFGLDIPEHHPAVVAKSFNLGPNKYPEDVEDAAGFRAIVDSYIDAMLELAKNIVRAISMTLGLPDDWVSDFFETPISTLRLLHYPPQASDASEYERGIGAHTDFGAITILLQDMVGGLQVWDRQNARWADVVPERGALVVNLGNMMMRWTNDAYLSNLHRVINKTGQERYSIPFFFSGNPDFLVQCLEGKTKAKYPPIKVGDWIAGRYADTYGDGKVETAQDLSVELDAGLL
ncbi:probable isopenicillin N synthase and related dioxygenases [Fusarium mangiferae]|uniref:Probable isopenicillin N synthase and related dioxygenases n=1 Tax=Fusarium mangiferae TaxID=192010 RepID=A0A1L7TYE5_FUSMA|nr:putative isopenicillin N synthase and related dioxygenases [Fusarium mangiferae]CVL03494.1 probable isopenicillin N synthase and related dioxygenases [Fusarium mangiferae]